MKKCVLNLHTNYSEGKVKIEEYIEKAVKEKVDAISIMDFQRLNAFAEAENYIKNNSIKNLKILYGGYYYIFDDNGEYGVKLYAKNKSGLKNLYKIQTEVNEVGFLDDYDKMMRLSNNLKDIIVVAGGMQSEIYQAFLNLEDEDKIIERTKKYDFIEIEPQYGIVINVKIIELCKKIEKPVIATHETCYINKDDYIAVKLNKYLSDVAIPVLEKVNVSSANFDNYKFKAQENIRKEFSYLKEKEFKTYAITNVNRLIDQVEDIELFDNKYYGGYPKFKEAKSTIKEVSKKALDKYKNNNKEVTKRYNEELNIIFKNKFEHIFYLMYLITKKARELKEPFGLRGAGSSSFVAYLLGITDIDPIKYNIPYETLFGTDENIAREPDFDFNFTDRTRDAIFKYLEEIFGEKRCAIAGTMGERYIRNCNKLIYQFEIENDVRVNNKEKVASKLYNTNYGIHPGGVIVTNSSKEILDYTPIDYRQSKKATEFDYHNLDMYLLKIDCLVHDGFNIISDLEKETGVSYKKINIDDEELVKYICSGKTDGINEFSSKWAKNLVKITKPKTFQDLVKISGLSHGTNVWLENGRYLINEHHLEELICNRDDIFLDLIDKGIDRITAEKIMTTVRKGKPAKNKEAHWDEYKKIMKEHKVDDWYIQSLEKILYMFPKAHACEYIRLSLIQTWYKKNYPKEFKKVLEKYNA